MEEVTKDDFTKKVLGVKEAVLVDFNADWCGPCQAQKPALEELSEAGHKIFSVNIDDEADLAEQYEVSSIPCLVLFKDGKEVERLVGLQPKGVIEDLFDE